MIYFFPRAMFNWVFKKPQVTKEAEADAEIQAKLRASFELMKDNKKKRPRSGDHHHWTNEEKQRFA